MNKDNFDEFYRKILERIKADLKDMQSSSSIIDMKEKIHELIGFIDSETLENKTILEEMIYSKLLETRGINPELNTHLYILYRNFSQNKISMQEAHRLYSQYSKEFSPVKNA